MVTGHQTSWTNGKTTSTLPISNLLSGNQSLQWNITSLIHSWTILPSKPSFIRDFPLLSLITKGYLAKLPQGNFRESVEVVHKNSCILPPRQTTFSCHRVIAILVAEEPSNLFILFDSWEGCPILRHCYI